MPAIFKPTITATFLERVQQTPQVVGFQFKKKNWIEVSFLEFFQQTELLSLGLLSLGVQKGDRIAILSSTRLEWALSDMAILGAHAVTVPLYGTSTGVEIAQLLEHSDSSVIFIENHAQLNALTPRLDSLPLLRSIILFDDGAPPEWTSPVQIFSLKEMFEKGEEKRRSDPHRFEQNLLAAAPEDPITICYTSGTTGIPKGVVLTHKNLMSVLTDCAQVFKQHIHTERETLLTFLPFSHIMGKIESMATYVFGWKESYSSSVQDLQKDFKEVQPTLMFSVPRIFEKAYSQIQARLGHMPWVKQKIFKHAVNMGLGKSIFGAIRYQLYKKAIFAQVAEGFGGRLKYAICGGAPLSKDLGEYFQVVGIHIFEGYGLTETCAPVCLNHFDHFKFGTVGKPLPEVSIKIADDGEILIQSDKVFSEYWKMPEETQATFEDAWFKTGDIGFLDPQGYLHITDRKKDLIITSGGKNAAPQKIENRFKTLSPLVEEFVVLGDRRKYLTALITLNPDMLQKFAENENILFSDVPELTQHTKVYAHIQAAVTELNQGLPQYETIKKFMILPQSFSIQTGELTASLKVKRGQISKKYRDQIESMYRES